jgi:hypothetical protein
MQVVIKKDFLNIIHLMSPHLSSCSFLSASYTSPLTSSLPSPSSYASISSLPIYSRLLSIFCCFFVFSSFIAFSFSPLYNSIFYLSNPAFAQGLNSAEHMSNLSYPWVPPYVYYTLMYFVTLLHILFSRFVIYYTHPRLCMFQDHRIIRFDFIPRIIFHACLSQMTQQSRHLRRDTAEN